MSNLLNTETGRAALYEARNFLLRRRLSRFFKRNLVIDYDRWSHGSQEFDLETLLGQLNDAHDDEIRDLYNLLGAIGGLERSLSDLSIYVDADNGDDQTGTGSSARPFASLWFVPYLPKYIDHFYRIILMSDVDMSGDEGSYIDFDQSIGPNGCVTIAGYGPEEHVLSGLDAVCTTQTSHIAAEYSGLNPPPTSAVMGVFVQNTTAGARLGETKFICYQQATANGELLTLGYPNILVNDTIRYVQPARELKARGFNFRFKMANDTQDPDTDTGARFGILNLRLEADQGTLTNMGSVAVNCTGPVCMSFVIITPDSGAGSASWQRMEWWAGSLNRQNLQDINVYDEIGLTDFANLKGRGGAFDCAGLIVKTDGFSDNILTFRGSYGNEVHRVVALGKLRVINSNGRFDNVSAYKGFNPSHSRLSLDNSICSDSGGNALDIYSSNVQVNTVSFHQTLQPISIFNGRLHTYGIGQEATYGQVGAAPSYLCQVSQGSLFVLSTAWSGLAPVTADCRLPDSNPDTTGAFPGFAAQLTDGLQSAVVRPG